MGESIRIAKSAGRCENGRIVNAQQQLITILCFILAIVVGYFVGRTTGERDRIDRE